MGCFDNKIALSTKHFSNIPYEILGAPHPSYHLLKEIESLPKITLPQHDIRLSHKRNVH